MNCLAAQERPCKLPANNGPYSCARHKGRKQQTETGEAELRVPQRWLLNIWCRLSNLDPVPLPASPIPATAGRNTASHRGPHGSPGFTYIWLKHVSYA